MSGSGKDFLIGAQISRDLAHAARLRQQEANLKKLQQEKNTNEVDGLANKGAAPGQIKSAEDAARQFEALLLHEMFKAMWKTIPQEGLVSGSREESLYRDMFNDALAQDISKGQGIGIKEVILRELKRNEKF